MANDKLWGILSGMVLFVLFTSLILTIAVDFGAEYGRDAQEIGGGSFNVSKFKQSSSEVNDNAQSYRARFEGGEVDDIDDASGLFSIVTDMINLITTPFKLLAEVLSNVLKVPIIFTNVILGLLSLLLILAVWSLLKKGE